MLGASAVFHVPKYVSVPVHGNAYLPLSQIRLLTLEGGKRWLNVTNETQEVLIYFILH